MVNSKALRINSKSKGRRGEQEVCTILRKRFPDYKFSRNWQQEGQIRGDILSDFFDERLLHPEVKIGKSHNVYKALKQCLECEPDKVPMVIHRKDREQWYVTVPLKYYLNSVV